MTVLILLLALVAGTLFPVQVGITGQLARLAGSAIWSAWTSLFVGVVVLLGLLAVLRVPWPSLATVAAGRWWILSGGVIGAYILTAAIFVGPKIGALGLFSLIVTGQMLATILLDHYGWLGFPAAPINLGRIAGAGLRIAGVVLVQRF